MEVEKDPARFFGEFSTVSASEGSVVEVFLLLFVMSESVGWAVVRLSCNGCLVFSVKIRSVAFLLNLIKILSKERSILFKIRFSMYSLLSVCDGGICGGV